MKWTSENTWEKNEPSKSSFIYPSNSFINNPFRGLDYIKKEIVPFLGGGEVSINNECIYQNFEGLESLKNKKFLVIGGGPSTNEVLINANNYDFIFTCNHYYKNKNVLDMNPYMVFLGDEVDLRNPELQAVLSKSDTRMCFENIGRPKQDLVYIKNLYKNKVSWAHTRYHSKIGAVTRIVSFLCCLYPSSIDIIGMDGYITADKQNKYYHSFQRDKKQTGSLERLNNENSIISRYKQQYLEFWDYILHDVGRKISFTNLGHKHPCNLSTEILVEKLGENYQDYLLNPEIRGITS